MSAAQPPEGAQAPLGGSGAKAVGAHGGVVSGARVWAWRARARGGAAAALLAVGLGACGGGGGGDGAGGTRTFDTRAVTAQDPGSAWARSTGDDWRDGVFMEIFVRAYQDSDGDGVGDLAGLVSRLDYLRDLGVRGLWLMPVYPSQDGDHGYAVTDYRAVAPEYGRLADLDTLIAQAHARGMGVVLDYVMNHSAAQHPAFQSSRSAAGNPYRDWYVWQNPAPGGWSIYGSDPWKNSANGAYFAGFWDQMPDFNLRSGTVLAWHQDNLRFWLNRGVDGFRFDAAGNLVENGPSAWENQPENHAIWSGVRTLLDGYERRYMVCEAPALPQRYAQGDSCKGAFAFGYQYDLADAVKGNADKVAAVAAYWASAPEGMAGFASNHDSFAGQRLYDQFGGDTARMKLAAATYLLQARTPFVYYGEEVGMGGAAALSGDPRLRTPMSWSADTRQAGFTTGQPFRALAANVATHNVQGQSGVSGSLLEHYRSLMALRNAHPALQRGQYLNARSSGLLMSFQRSLPGSGGERVLLAYNYGGAPGSIAVAGLEPGASYSGEGPSLGQTVVADPSGAAVLALPAQSYAFYRRANP
ncbi:MAG: alpha-amylase family glycosyl hydrolase [Rhodoferax sp.]